MSRFYDIETKLMTKPRHKEDIDIDIDNDIDINIMYKYIIFFGIMSLRSIIPGAQALRGKGTRAYALGLVLGRGLGAGAL
jgi:hypothetical protein